MSVVDNDDRRFLLADRIGKPLRRIVDCKQAKILACEVLVKVRFARAGLTYQESISVDYSEPRDVLFASDENSRLDKTPPARQCRKCRRVTCYSKQLKSPLAVAV